MEDIERLAVAQALQRRIGDAVSTKNPDGLRGKADAQMRRLYEEMGVKSIDIKVRGQKVGTYSAKVGKAKPPKTVRDLSIDDRGAVKAWAKDNYMELEEWFDSALYDFARFCLDTYGEVPDGCSVKDVELPGKPEGFEGTTLRVDPEKVAEALHGELPGVVAGLLEGSEDL